MKKSRVVIGGKRINESASFVYNLQPVNEFFFSAEGGVRSLIRVTSKANRRKAEKVLQKNRFLIVFFLVVKNVFHYMIAKFSCLIRTHKISSSRSQTLRRTGKSCLCNVGLEPCFLDSTSDYYCNMSTLSEVPVIDFAKCG